MIYIARNANGAYNNIIEIDLQNVPEYERLTGLTLELPDVQEPVVDNGTAPVDDMEAALNELGVTTRE